jgi:hypothetical protein
MNDNKAYVFMMLGLFGMIAAVSIFGDGFDSEQTKKFKEQEKTKQLQIQWKIDSLNAVKSNGNIK